MTPHSPASTAVPPEFSDAELLRRFADSQDQAAFTQLTARYVNLVYSIAVRQLAGDTHLAQDVTQAVFNDVAHKARALANYRILSSWLYTSTCFTAAKAVRTEQRRRKREGEASTMHDSLNLSEYDAEWIRLRPFLDRAMQELRAEDREALLLRFFEAKNFSEIGERLKLTENAARMRVDRALEKLRTKLTRCGITSTAIVLSGTLTANVVTTAPIGLAGSVTAGALASISSAGTVTLLQWLALNKVISVSTVALLSAGAMIVHWEEQEQSALKSEYASLSQASERTGRLERQIEELTQSAREVATLRQDDAELERLNEDATELRRRVEATRGIVSAPGSGVQSTKLPRPGEVYELKQLDQPPRIKYQPRPKYPAALRQAGLSGEATITFVVRPDGTVSELSAIDATHKTFETAAIEAVKGWTYAPGMKDGKAVATKMVVPMIFSLTSAESNPAWF